MDATASRPRGEFVSSMPARPSAGFQSLRTSTTGFSGGLVSRIMPALAVPPTATELAMAAAARAEATATAVHVEPDATAILEAEMIRREQIRQSEHAMALAELEAERERMRAATTRLGQLAGEVQRLRMTLIAEMRSEAGEILLQGARKLAHDSLRADETLLAAMAIDAAAALGGDERVVRVNPDDLARLEGRLGEGYRLVADPGVSAGCIVEGHGGSIEATVEAAASALRADTEGWRRAG